MDRDIGTWRRLFLAVAAVAFVFLGWAPGVAEDLGLTKAPTVADPPVVEEAEAEGLPLPLPLDFTGWRRLEAARRIAAGETVYCVTIQVAGVPIEQPGPEDCFLGDPEDWWDG